MSNLQQREKTIKIIGTTELYWTHLKEDDKLKWKFFSRTLTFIGAILVTKTGIPHVDYIIAALTTSFATLIIESQRSYRKLSIKLRRKIVRACIFLGSWCITALGVIYFSQLLLFTLAAFHRMLTLPETFDSKPQTIQFYAAAVTISIVLCITIKMIKDPKTKNAIYHLPKDLLEKVLIRKNIKSKNFLEFAHFEISVILICLAYSNISAELLKITFMTLNHF